MRDGLTPRCSAIRTKSASDSACIFPITTPRCCFVVFSAFPSSAAICLLSKPAATSAKTCRSRGVRLAYRVFSEFRSTASASARRVRCVAREIASNRAARLTGFSRKSTAPDFIACTVEGTSPCPVTNNTATCGIRWANALCRRSPSMPGIRRSEITHERRWTSAIARNSSADEKATTSVPAAASIRTRAFRIDSSSSTTATISLPLIIPALAFAVIRYSLATPATRFRTWNHDQGSAGQKSARHAPLRSNERSQGPSPFPSAW